VGHLTKRFRWLALLLLASTTEALAQQAPHIGYVYPAGGQVGTTFEVTVGGQYLNGTTNAYVSGTGVQAVVPAYEPLITGKQATALRERLQELRKKEKEKDPVVLKEITEIRKKLAAFDKKRLTPALADTMLVRITIAPNAALGNRELRLATFTGLSNPLVFQVGQLSEFREAEPNPDPDPLVMMESKSSKPLRSALSNTNAPVTATAITLPATLNGQILPGEVDRFRFKAHQRQQLVVVISARELIPYLADAVPGWFQAKVALYNSQGKELTYDDHYRFHPDPVLFYPIPKEGEYLLEIKDSLYRGREDFVYRIAVGELPFITSVFPLGGKAGTQAPIVIGGWNLPVASTTLDLQGVEPGVYPYAVRNKVQVSNRVSFLVDRLPECLKKSPSDSVTNAQQVTPPIIINGHIDRPGDVDVFRFEGHTGDQIVAEVYARRLDSPLDSVLKLTDAAGKQLAFNDDHEDKGSGLNTHHADSYLTATLPVNGTYFLYLWDAQQKGGRAYSYRLRLSSPRPDFELRAVPSSLSSRPGGSVPINVFALRRDGFTNEIAVALKDAPEGFRLSSGTLQGTQEQIKVTLMVPSKSPKDPVSLSLVGRATPDDRELLHRAVPADDMMQAFAYRHLVPANELKVLVATGPPPKPPEKERKSTSTAAPPKVLPVKLPAGGTAKVQVKIPTTTYSGKLQLELDEPPEGITIKSFTPTRDGAEVVLQADRAVVKSGQKGELTITAYAERTQSKTLPNKPRTPLGTIPPVPFEIVTQPATQK
jgi:hypothetical protein